MRSDAKASSAGTTPGRAKGPGSLGRGALATRGASLTSNGSGAPSAGRLFAFLLALLAAAALFLALAVSALATAPTVPATFSSAVTTKSAVLEAEINPQGEATSYRFEWGTADCDSNPCTSTPVPNAGIGSGAVAVKVAKEITGLSADTTYHFRVVASNGSGTTNGPDTTFSTFAPFVAQTDCPNQAFRYGPSALLPDCRAYEMVSPVDKNGGDITNLPEALPRWKESRFKAMAAFVQAARDGGKITYSSESSFGDQPTNLLSNQYIATRGPEGWTTHGIDPPKEGELLGAFVSGPELVNNWWGFTEDLSSGFLWNFNDPPLTADANPGYPNFYRRDLLGGDFEALTNTPSLGGAPQVPGGPTEESIDFYIENNIYDFSEDGRTAYFRATQALTSDADPTNTEGQLYVFSEGELHLLSVLPDGTAAPFNNVMGTGTAATVSVGTRWASEDGTRVYWRAGNAEGVSIAAYPIYLRVNPTEEQSAIAAGECTEPDKACTVKVSSDHAVTEAMSADGGKMWFTEATKLYEYDADADTSTLISNEAEGILGASEDLSRVYFISREALAPAATAGEPNLYLREGGEETFIAQLSELDIAGEADNPAKEPQNLTYNLANSTTAIDHSARVSADGRYATFMSLASLTGYDNIDAVNGEPDAEVFQYDAQAEELLCVSCNPSGARPVGRELAEPFRRSSETQFAGFTDIWAAAWIPGPEHILGHTRVLMEDGTVFFNSFDALVARDSNGVQDVYQWKPEGVRGCERPGGCVELLSTGQSREESRFAEADADGEEVFFTTSTGISPQDPGSIDLYVAKAGGGYPLPIGPPECVGDACQSIPAAPSDPTPASASFRGAGDPAPPKARRRCRVQRKAKGSAASKQAKQRAKRCRRVNRRAGR